MEGRGAWYQGVKLSLFDVSSGSALSEVKSLVIGKRGSESQVLYDHHALAWLSADNGEDHRLVIPIDEHTTEYDSAWYDYSQPSSHYDWTQSGAYIFDINTGIEPSLTMSAQLITENRNQQSYKPYSFLDRMVLQGETLHYAHANTLYSKAISDL